MPTPRSSTSLFDSDGERKPVVEIAVSSVMGMSAEFETVTARMRPRRKRDWEMGRAAKKRKARRSPAAMLSMLSTMRTQRDSMASTEEEEPTEAKRRAGRKTVKTMRLSVRATSGRRMPRRARTTPMKPIK